MGHLSRPESTADVAAAVRAARSGGVEVSVRSGGHSYTCQSIKKGGMHFDLRRLDKIEVVGEGQVGIGRRIQQNSLTNCWINYSP